MYVVREGYEGLVRGNEGAPKRKVIFEEHKHPHRQQHDGDDSAEDKLINNLRFGDGHLLKEGRATLLIILVDEV